MSERNRWIDIAKGIGIILVVVGHVNRGLHFSGIMPSEGFFRISDSVVYSFHMPLFFFLAGLLFLESLARRGGHRLVLGKIDTIVYPYVVWSLLQGLVEVAMSSHTNSHTRLADVLAFPWAPRSQFWFLYVLFLVFVFSSVLFRWLPGRFAWVVVAMAVPLHLASDASWMGDVPGKFAANLVFFALGILCATRSHDWLSGRSWLPYWTPLFLGGQLLFHGVLDEVYTATNVASLGLAVVSIAFVVSLSRRLASIGARPLEFLGSVSMVVYILHLLVFAGARIILVKLGVHSYALHLVAGCVLGLSIPVGVDWIAARLGLRYLFSAPIASGFAPRPS